MRALTVGLAAYRAVRVWDRDKIALDVRDRVLRWVIDVDETFQPRGNVERGTRAYARRQWLDELLHCPYCLGVWVAAACAVLERNRLTRVLVVALAGAGLQALLEDWDRRDDGPAE